MVDLLRADSERTLADVDHRMRHALRAAAQAAGSKARMLMENALGRPALRDGGCGAQAYFGGEIDTVLELVRPLVIQLNAGMPGFNEWLDRTGYGDDVDMIRALLAWCEHDPAVKHVAARLQHGLSKLN
jgi:hypothetical protein